MVSFNCDSCNDVVKKPKLDQHHNQRCGASFTCLDCSLTFYSPVEWKGHTSCVSEAQKYERSVYRGEKGKGKVQGQQQQQQQQQQNGNANVNGKRKERETESSATVTAQPPVSAPAEEEKQSKKDKKSKKQKAEAEPATPVAATAPTLASRISKLVDDSSVSLYDALERLSKAEGKEEKKLRKEILKGVKVEKDGQLSWA